jgi:tetratricopeptide (TPR) repeat protein
MSATATPFRRLRIAVLALLVSSLLFRGAVADALVVRGDDFLYRGDTLQALAHYRRALVVDARSSVAADRFTFVAMMRRSHSSLNDCIIVASRFLQRGESAGVRSGRALCFLALRRYHSARQDFERAAALNHSARDLVFAGWAAKRTGDGRGARHLWALALQWSPAYQPARSALGRR